MNDLRLSWIALATFCLAGTAASAEESARGLWLRDTGTARLQIAPCGEKLCGTIVWVQIGRAHV